jgi:hypothetical protein
MTCHQKCLNSRRVVRFEVSTAVTMMIIIFWEMTPCGSYKNRRFGGSYRLHLLYKSLQLRSVTCSHSRTLKMEAIRSSETSVLIRATRRHLPEDDNHPYKSVLPVLDKIAIELTNFVLTLNIICVGICKIQPLKDHVDHQKNHTKTSFI